MNRRSFMRGAVAAGAAGTVTATAAASATSPFEPIVLAADVPEYWRKAREDIEKKQAFLSTPEQRLRRAAAEIRAAMEELGVESYMVMIREKEAGVAQVLDFNESGGLHQMREIA